MEKDNISRYSALDGLRGLAVLMVFLNHVYTDKILNAVPDSMRWLFENFFLSGKVGIALLFLLSGFLMAYIYPDPKYIPFLQKRYTRIFPLFVTMAFVMLVIKLNPSFSAITRLGILLFIPLCVHIIWVYVIKRINKSFISKGIFWIFIIIQTLVCLWYAGWIMRHPAIVFNQELPALIREGSIFLVNSTLTLPFGNYIPFLDGVYWSLVSEVLFYIIYPIICVPLVALLKKHSRFIKILFIFLLIPFLVGLDLISYRIFTFNMLQIPLFSYFATGIGLGYLRRNKSSFFDTIHLSFSKPLLYFLPVCAFIFLIILLHVLSTIYFPQYYQWLRSLWAIPLIVIVGIALNEKTSIAKLFQSKFLIFMGTISYSVYLCHTAIIETAKLIYTPSHYLNNILYILVVLIVVIIISSILYYLLEKPYFSKTAKDKKNIKVIANNDINKKQVLIPTAIILLFPIIIFIAYQSNFNFSSIQYPYFKDALVYPKLDKTTHIISLKNYPTASFQFRSKADNLGIVTLNIHYELLRKNATIKDNGEKSFTFKIKEHTAKDWYSISSYRPKEIGNSTQYPFGFPIITNSRGKLYDVELRLSNSQLPETLKINTTNSVLKTVHHINKSDLIKNPYKLFLFLFNKVENTFSTKEAQYVIILSLPFIILLTAILVINRNKKDI